MGCSSSKDVESPVKKSKEGWNAVLPKGLAVQMDRSLKSSDGGYIAAIFSANYGSLRDAGLAKKDEHLLNRKVSGNDLHKVSKAGANLPSEIYESTRFQAGALRNSLPDLKVGLPKLSIENEAPVHRSKVDLVGEPETINTWELMKGLDDGEFSPKEAASPPMAGTASALSTPQTAENDSSPPVAEPSAVLESTPPAVPPLKPEGRSTPLSTKLIDPPPPPAPVTTSVRRTTFGKKAGSRERPKSFNVIRSVEEVDAIAARSRTPPPAWDKGSTRTHEIRQPSRKAASPIDNSDENVPRTTMPQISSLGQSVSGPPPLSHEEEAAIPAISSESSSWSLDNSLQRALSFKYIFNSSGNKNCSHESFAAQGTDSAMDVSDLTFKARFSEADGLSSPSSPEFSAAASLKDWLPDSGPKLSVASQPDEFPTSVRRSIFGALQDSFSVTELTRQKSENADSVPSKRAHSINLYGDSAELANAGKKALFSQHSLLNTPVNETQQSDSPLFDPELLESFEKAMEQLSEEEWYAVRQMEEDAVSPRDFLHVVNSLRRNGISMQNRTRKGDAAATGNKILEASFEGSLNLIRLDSGHDKIAPLPQVTEEKKMPRHNLSDSLEQKGLPIGGNQRVVLYSTSLQSNAKIYEDCNTVRTILRSLGASFDEKNISLHPEYEQELRHLLEMPAIVPRLFVKGRYIGGVDDILQFQKKGILGSLLREVLPVGVRKAPCLCRGGKFLICPLCRGRGKIVKLGEGTSSCRHCSGTGLIKCPNC